MTYVWILKVRRDKANFIRQCLFPVYRQYIPLEKIVVTFPFSEQITKKKFIFR